LWLWLNLGLGALFVLAIVGVPLWLVVKRPDGPPALADLPGWRRAREHRARQAAARATARPSAAPWVPRQPADGQWLGYQPAGQRRNSATEN
jgi:hypothetical protein